MSISIDAKSAALLVIDIQQGVVETMGFEAAYLERVSQAIRLARRASIKVIYLKMAYREGAPEISSNNRMLYNFAKSGAMYESEQTSQLHSKIIPQPNEVIVTKKRVSAFTGSELDLILRAQKVEELILCGNATRMGLLATFFSATDRDYRVTILSDCCADMEPQVHDVLMAKIFPLQADVVSLEDWQEQLTE